MALQWSRNEWDFNFHCWTMHCCNEITTRPYDISTTRAAPHKDVTLQRRQTIRREIDSSCAIKKHTLVCGNDIEQCHRTAAKTQRRQQFMYCILLWNEKMIYVHCGMGALRMDGSDNALVMALQGNSGWKYSTCKYWVCLWFNTPASALRHWRWRVYIIVQIQEEVV